MQQHNLLMAQRIAGFLDFGRPNKICCCYEIAFGCIKAQQGRHFLRTRNILSVAVKGLIQKSGLHPVQGNLNLKGCHLTEYQLSPLFGCHPLISLNRLILFR
jgi:hypothetical protein